MLPILSGKVFLLGALVGIIVQLSWIVSDNTKLNWTIDKIHHFNLAGYYHAIYFVVMSGLILSILCRTILVYNVRDTLVSKTSLTVMWISLVGYYFMHYLDDHYALSNNKYMLFLTVGVSIIVYIVGSFKDSGMTWMIGAGVVVVFIVFMAIVCKVIGYNPEYSHNVLNLLRGINNALR